MPRLIALYSPTPQSGKSTVATYLASKDWHCVSFAKPLKNMLEPLLRCFVDDELQIYDMLYGTDKQRVIPELGINSRRLLQTLGTDWGRDIVHKDIWIKCWQAQVARAMANGHNVVTDDLRFPNEMAAVKAMGGKCWWIERATDAHTYGHASEGALNDMADQFNAVIHNNGTMELLFCKIDLHLDDPNLQQVTINLDGIKKATLDV